MRSCYLRFSVGVPEGDCDCARRVAWARDLASGTARTYPGW